MIKCHLIEQRGEEREGVYLFTVSGRWKSSGEHLVCILSSHGWQLNSV